jgi:hypothetical protein
MHTEYDRIFGDFPANITVYTTYIYGSGHPIYLYISAAVAVHGYHKQTFTGILDGMRRESLPACATLPAATAAVNVQRCHTNVNQTYMLACAWMLAGS